MHCLATIHNVTERRQTDATHTDATLWHKGDR